MENLRRCPFCGGKADIITRWDVYVGRFSTKVFCKKCRANSGVWFQKPKAIESWNRRVSDADLD